MIEAVLRKAGQVAKDPMLRRWLWRRALGKTKPPAPFRPHRPPYLTDIDPGPPPASDDRFAKFASARPTQPITLDLAGLKVLVEPDDVDALFRRDFDDVEQLLALHRFAWADSNADPAWVAAIWKCWLTRCATPNDDWPWHPYTAAERLIALLSFAERHGLPEPAQETWDCLCAHGPAILRRLEYFGDHYTGNHLANNGRGIFRLGVALGWKKIADIGCVLLLAEADRIFGKSGVLNEGSAHYHLLLSKNYDEAAAWAKRAEHADAAKLRAVADKAKHAAGGLILSGGLPLIGDISPDLAPDRLVPVFSRTDADLSQDGWFRLEQGDWSLLLYAPSSGWPPMPGHGHQDLGSFELHWRGIPVIVDPGRGAYGESGDAALYRSAVVHNGITFKGRDPRPANRPYYDDAFRSLAAGDVPTVLKQWNALTLRYGMHDRKLERCFKALETSFAIEDSIFGDGRQDIERRFVIPHPVASVANVAVITTAKGRLRLSADAPLTMQDITRWTSYGRGEAARLLVAPLSAALPWQGRILLEPL